MTADINDRRDNVLIFRKRPPPPRDVILSCIAAAWIKAWDGYQPADKPSRQRLKRLSLRVVDDRDTDAAPGADR
jgi:hypothetical protein